MIKLVHFIHGLNTGGAETLVKNYALLLDKSKFDLTIVCHERLGSPYEDILKEAGVSVIYVSDEIKAWGKKNLFSKICNRIVLYIKIRRHIKKLNPDILHYHLTLTPYLCFARLSKRCAILLTVHSDPHRLWFSGIKGRQKDFKCVQYLLRHYNMYLIALHEGMKQELMQLFHTNNVLQLNNGIDLDVFHKLIDFAEKRKALCIPQNAFVVVHVGRFDPVKNHDYLLRIFCEVKKIKQNAFLLMVGNGKLKQVIQHDIESLGLQESTMILSDRTDVPEILQASDAALFPSFIEGLGIAVIEMQAAGLPCVVSDGVPKSAMVTNKIRFLSLQESPEEWARQLLDLVMDNEPIKYYGLEKWNMRDIVKDLEAIYEKVSENGRKQNR